MWDNDPVELRRYVGRALERKKYRLPSSQPIAAPCGVKDVSGASLFSLWSHDTIVVGDASERLVTTAEFTFEANVRDRETSMTSTRHATHEI